MRRTAPARLVVGIDGGNSKAHLVIAATDGTLLAAEAGPTVSHQAVGIEVAMENLERLLARAARRAGLNPAQRPLAASGSLCVAGADTPADVRLITRAIADRDLFARFTVQNDTLAALRAGAPLGWGIAIICGAGVNAVGRTQDGRQAAFPALGDISGDWGGGSAVGMAALQAAVRARDGRGPRTRLEQAVPAAFGLKRPLDVTMALYRGRLSESRLRRVAPLVYRVARDGDPVAGQIVDRLADELAAMGIALLRRLHLLRRPVDVVLAGGMLAGGEPRLIARVGAGIRAAAPAAMVRVLREPPVLGAALDALTLAGLPAGSAAERRLRSSTIRFGGASGTGTEA